MASLSKPGISSASVVAIPKDWSQTWFANLVNNIFQGSDVRNAIGANGITITGNITTPYATISFGGASAPITGPIIIKSDGVAGDGTLIIESPSGSTEWNFYDQGSLPTTPPDGVTFVGGYTSPVRGRIIIGDGTGWFLRFAAETAGTGAITDIFNFSDGGGGQNYFTVNTAASAIVFQVRNGGGVFAAGNAGAGQFVFGAAGGYTGGAVTNDGIINYDTTGGALTLAARSTAGSTSIVLRTSNAGSDTARLQISSAGAVTITGTLQTSAGVGFNGVAVATRVTGFGTPVGGAVVASYNITDAGGANSNTNKCVAEILTVLKAAGLIGA